MNQETIKHIISVIEKKGIDSWWAERDGGEMVPEAYRNNGIEYIRGRDTMDVWFDSGSSLFASQQPNAIDAPETLEPADVYIEGSDQHRGWFQSSLLTTGK